LFAGSTTTDFPLQLTIDGRYVDNHAKDWGIGCRGGAIRTQFIKGTVTVKGTFKDNVYVVRYIG
jgi:hypothetical protein